MELAGEQPVQVLKFLKVLGKAFMTRLSRIGSSVMYSFEMSGYARAAAHLRSMGYHEEAENCYKMMRELK